MEAIFRKCTALYVRVSRKSLYTWFITYLFTSFYLHFLGPSDPYGHLHILGRAWCVATP